jgi:plasmid stabilization system protein ParE
MAYSVEVTTRAKNELDEAVRYIARYSSDKAMLFSFEAETAIESLGESPARCPIAPECHSDERAIRQLLVGQYRILFEIEDVTVTVLHVRHQKRQPFSLDYI